MRHESDCSFTEQYNLNKMASAFPEHLKVSDFLICAICHQPYRKPKILPCQHTFCEHCLVSLLTNEGELKCPLCCMSWQLPEGGVSKVKDNDFAANLKLLLDRNQNNPCQDGRSTKLAVCNGCSDHEAMYWCTDCDKNLCTSCINTLHKNLEKVHRVITMEEHNKAQSSNLANVFLQKETYCDIHPANQVKFYSEKCKSAVCIDCAVTKHRGTEHVLKDLQEVADVYAREVRDLLQKGSELGEIMGNGKIEAEQSSRDRPEAECQANKKKVTKSTDKVQEQAKVNEKRLEATMANDTDQTPTKAGGANDSADDADIKIRKAEDEEISRPIQASGDKSSDPDLAESEPLSQSINRLIMLQAPFVLIPLVVWGFLRRSEVQCTCKQLLRCEEGTF